MTRQIDLNADLGEWSSAGTPSGADADPIGDDAAMLSLVSSANIACGGHAGDAETMLRTLRVAAESGVVIGGHPGYRDRESFGRRDIAMPLDNIVRLVVDQIATLGAIAASVSVDVRYVKLHGALGNLAARDAEVARAVVAALQSVDDQLAVLAISGTQLEIVARAKEAPVFSEVFADRAYQPNGQLLPRSEPGAVLHDPGEAAERLLGFVETGLMPVVGAAPIPLDAHSICVHGDSPGALELTRRIRRDLTAAGIELTSFISPHPHVPS